MNDSHAASRQYEIRLEGHLDSKHMKGNAR
jgi:hypothetical protein